MDLTRWLTRALVTLGLLTVLPAFAQSQSYVNSSDTYSWIDASTHNRIRAYSAAYTYPGIANPIAFPRTGPPYFFYTPTGASCGTSGTVIDDRLSDEIDIGFTFKFAGVNFTKLRVDTNGRIQFNNNLTCGAGTDNGTPTIYTYDYPDANMNYTMRIYGADLDSTPKNFKDGAVSTPVNAAYATVCLDDAQCYISVATIGTAPTRKFVVTWNNVPKWITAGQIAGNFNLQIILEEGGDFVYQYGNVVDAQANVPAQIGWEVNVNDYDIKQTALPTNNSAIRYQVPRPIALYQMEQSTWTAAAGQVVDSSGNNRHGTKLGAAAPTAGGYACNGSNIPANTSAATIDGINTGINVLSDLGGVGSITFWYKPNNWAGSGAVSAQLFDASNAANSWFYLSKRMNGANARLRFVVRDDTNTSQIVETSDMTSSVLSGTGWVHIGVSWNFNTLTGGSKDRLRIYVNGAAIGSGNSVQTLFTSAGAPVAGIDTITLGDNRSTFIDGTNGTGNSANGVIDEFRMYNLEAGFGQVLSDYGQLAGCSNHYAIAHAGSGATPTNGATCTANAVAIAMHTSAEANIATSSTITLSTSTGQGNWSLVSGYGVLNNGTANDGIATYKFNNEAQVVLSLSHTTPGVVNINVTDGSFTEKAGAEDANLNIVSCSVSGFNGCDLRTPRCVPGVADYDQLNTRLAGRAFKLDAVTLNASGVLDTTFNGVVTVDLVANLSVTTPAAGSNCPASQTAVVPLGSVTFSAGRPPVAGLVVGAGALAAVTPGYSAYRDVRVRFTCDAANCPPAGVTSCSRDAFAVRPTDLQLSTSSMTNASVVSGTPKLTAGTQFPMVAQAITATGTNALGYNGTPQIAATVAAQSVSAQSVASPVTTTDYSDRLKDANVNSVALFNSASASSGQANASLFYLDYGGFRILANGAKDTAYVDAALDVPGKDCVSDSSSNADADPDADRELFGCVVANQSNSALVGRFYPNSFSLTSSAITQGCVAGAFSYEGQPFAVNAAISARSNGAVVTAAVMPRYAAGAVTFAAENNNAGTDLIGRLSGLSGAWVNGVYTVAAPSVVFSRLAAADGPFDALELGISVVDATDALNLGAARNMLPTNATACTSATCTHQKLGSPLKMRYGRLRMKNAYGSELLALPVALEAQYWVGNYYATHTLDGCTAIPMSSITMGNYLGNLSACETQMSPTISVALSSGTLPGTGLVLSKPGVDNGGSVDLAINVTAVAAGKTCVGPTESNATAASMPWFGPNQGARATFGIYKSPLIYRRENY